MSRRRDNGAVKGPASALTSFLAGLGVQPSTRLTTWGNSSSLQTDGGQLAPDGPINDEQHLDPAGAVTARTVEAGPSIVGEGIDAAVDDGEPGKRSTSEQADVKPVKRARKRASSILSDDLDAVATPVAGPSTSSTPVPTNNSAKPGLLKAIGESMRCGGCNKFFTITAYTKEHPSVKSTWLCIECCFIHGIDPYEKPKKPKAKPPVKKEDRGKLVHYEERKGVKALGDICIHLIGQYIEDVEQLGDIGGINMDRVCRIISKSRRLTPETAPLFYSSDRKQLSMYDCTRLVHESYLTLANLCPKLESLHLHLCGQLSTDAVTFWGTTLKLRRLELFAPFLVRKQGWINLFSSLGNQLEGFLITQSPRIDLETITALVEYCPNLTELRLAEIGHLNGDCLLPLAKLKHLTSLDLSSPETSLTSDSVIALLSEIGSNLVSLDLTDNAELTDEILPAIASYCPRLRHLHLRNLPELTDDGVAHFFTTLKASHPGFETIDLEKGHDLASKAVRAIIAQSSQTIEKLSLIGWRLADQNALSELSRCGRLRELDLGWCRRVTDFTLKDILNGCNEIKTIRVWGCNQLTDAVPRKKGVQVIGIETHSI